MMETFFSIVAVCISCLIAWKWWLVAQPPCTKLEFERVVKQLNQLTQDMAAIQQSADSIRSAVAVAGIGRQR